MRYADMVSCRSVRRWIRVTSAPPRASQTAACPAELPPPTTATREAPHSCASGGPARVERANALVVGEVVEWEPPVVGAGGEQDCARGDLVLLFHSHDVSSVAGFG